MTSEMRQMHDKSVLAPVHPNDITCQEKLGALSSIIFMKQKRCGKIKVRYCADGRPQRKLYEKDEATSPTVKTESVILTAVQDAVEKRDVAIVDIPGAFLNAYLDEIVYMRIEGDVADALIEVAPSIYGPTATTTTSGKTLLFVCFTRALYVT